MKVTANPLGYEQTSEQTMANRMLVPKLTEETCGTSQSFGPNGFGRLTEKRWDDHHHGRKMQPCKRPFAQQTCKYRLHVREGHTPSRSYFYILVSFTLTAGSRKRQDKTHSLGGKKAPLSFGPTGQVIPGKFGHMPTESPS